MAPSILTVKAKRETRWILSDFAKICENYVAPHRRCYSNSVALDRRDYSLKHHLRGKKMVPKVIGFNHPHCPTAFYNIISITQQEQRARQKEGFSGLLSVTLKLIRAPVSLT